MKLFVRYVYQHLPLLLLIVSALLLQSLCYSLYGIDMEIILYTEGLVLCVLCIYAMTRFFSVKKTYTDLQRIHDGESAAITEYPETIDVIEKEEYRIIQLLIQDSKQKSMASKEKYDAMMDYYTVWAHQIKTPIASIKLKLQNEDTEFSRSIARDVFRIEQYAEMVLTFLRLDSSSTDYVFKMQDMDVIIKGVVRKLSGEFIDRKLSLQLEETQLKSITDEKWISFVIEQVLTNALKYTKEGGIHIYAEDNDTLCIQDTGIGIRKEDLPRIFENGFTGYNGRMDKKATGIGLYLCKRVCDNLNHEIEVTSGKEGTLVKIHFLQNCKK